MENKINVAQLLKDCPKGMELDCAMWNNVRLKCVDIDSTYPIVITYQAGENICVAEFTEYGCWNQVENAKCVIFPKGKTTWEGFVPPREFKDGDIVVNNIGKPFILKFYDLSKDNVCTYCGINCWDNFELSSEYWTCARDIRYATEEEKAKLFDVIKANGYKWDEETKTLEELPKFKAGDRIQNKYNGKQFTITKIYDLWNYFLESIFLVVSFLLGILIFILKKENKTVVPSAVAGAFLMLFLILGIDTIDEYRFPSITPIDVYRGKTTLEITYRDSIAIDSIVVWKEEVK